MVWKAEEEEKKGPKALTHIRTDSEGGRKRGAGSRRASEHAQPK